MAAPLAVTSFAGRDQRWALPRRRCAGCPSPASGARLSASPRLGRLVGRSVQLPRLVVSFVDMGLLIAGRGAVLGAYGAATSGPVCADASSLHGPDPPRCRCCLVCRDRTAVHRLQRTQRGQPTSGCLPALARYDAAAGRRCPVERAGRRPIPHNGSTGHRRYAGAWCPRCGVTLPRSAPTPPKQWRRSGPGGHAQPGSSHLGHRHCSWKNERVIDGLQVEPAVGQQVSAPRGR